MPVTAELLQPNPGHSLIEDYTALHPDDIAVEHGRDAITYRELMDWSAAIAARLRDAGAAPDVPVAVVTERSIARIAALLGVLRSGAAYVPIDPSNPRRRIDYLIDDCAASLAVADPSVVLSGLQTIDPSEARRSADQTVLPRVGSLDDLAYFIYTSGSTGNPKGVAMTHRPLANLVDWQVARFTRPQARTLQFTSLSFDVAYQEIITTLVCGGTLVSVDEATRSDFAALADVVVEAEIERLFLPFVALDDLARAFEANGAYPTHLREVITAGEQLRITTALERLFEETSATLDNQYGPSETHVVTAERLSGEPRRWPRLPPIGTPIDNVEARLLTPDGFPVARGEAGLLHIGGIALARGYSRRPALTAERFVPYPDGARGARLYNTGDIARENENGLLEFLGRADDQVKIRGHRVELGELEAELARSPFVAAAAATAPEDASGTRRLVAYVVLEPEGDVAGVREFLAARLPSHMIPARIVSLDRLPVTSTGKVDRRSLEENDPRVDPHLRLEEDGVRRAATEPRRLHELVAEVTGSGVVTGSERLQDIGLDSLAATRLAVRIGRDWDVRLSPADIFDAETVADLERLLPPRPARADDAVATAAGVSPSRAEEARLSYGQRRLWFFEQLTEGSTAHNLPARIELHELTADDVQGALNQLVERHESLRTTFAASAGGPVQVIHEARPLRLDAVDLSDLTSSEQEERLRELVKRDRDTPFRLDEWPLIRCRFAYLGGGEAVLTLVVHHIVADGWSLNVFADDLRALLSGEELQPLPLQYRDFTMSQLGIVDSREGTELASYWRTQLADVPAALELPADRQRPPVPSYRCGEIPFELGLDLDDAVVECARRHGVTPFMVYLSALAAVVARYADEDVFCIGTAAAGRTRVELEPLLGFLVNTIPLRMDLSGDPTFAQLLRRTRQTTLEALRHQDLPFEVIVEELGIQRDPSRMPLLQVFFAYDGSPPQPPGSKARLATPPLPQAGGAFEVTLSMWHDGHKHVGAIRYSTDLFTEATASRFAGHISVFLAAAVANPGGSCSDVPIVVGEERRDILARSLGPRIEFDRSRRVHEMFRDRVRAAPEATALEFEGEVVTYRELDERSDQLGRHLRRNGVRAESIVAVCAKRSVELIVAVVGIAKAGGAYMPLDPAYPAARLEYMLNDARPAAVLTQRALVDMVPVFAAPTILLDPDSAAWTESSGEIERDGRSPWDLAYVIYTSGSTGQPKGVLLAHEGLMNLVLEKHRTLRIKAGDRILQFASPSFDSFVSEVFQALSAGATLVLFPAEALIPGPELTQLLREARITHATVPPSVLGALDPDELPELGTVMSAGEACTAALVARWADARRFLNGYGPAEATVGATFAELALDAGTPPIGTPLANKSAYVLTRGMQLAPLNVRGELYLGGAGVARAYLGKSGLTAERFVPDPFGRSGARLYRTGDLARLRPDGVLEFAGRKDDQVKVRGFRVELGEIASILRRHDAVSDAAVRIIEYGPGDQRLVAYAVSDEPEIQPEELRTFVRKHVPPFMVPSAVVVVPALPLTPNGKVDYRRLPDPIFLGGGEAGRPATTPTEKIVAEIWRRVLRLEQMPSALDDFFALGGHSLVAAQVLASVERQVGVSLPLRALFESPTLQDFAGILDAAVTASAPRRLAGRESQPEEGARLADSSATSGRELPTGEEADHRFSRVPVVTAASSTFRRIAEELAEAGSRELVTLSQIEECADMTGPATLVVPPEDASQRLLALAGDRSWGVFTARDVRTARRMLDRLVSPIARSSTTVAGFTGGAGREATPKPLGAVRHTLMSESGLLLLQAHGRECLLHFADGVVCGLARHAEIPELRGPGLPACCASGRVDGSACYRYETAAHQRLNAAEVPARIWFINTCFGLRLGHRGVAAPWSLALRPFDGEACAVVISLWPVSGARWSGEVFREELSRGASLGEAVAAVNSCIAAEATADGVFTLIGDAGWIPWPAPEPSTCRGEHYRAREGRKRYFAALEALTTRLSALRITAVQGVPWLPERTQPLEQRLLTLWETEHDDELALAECEAELLAMELEVVQFFVEDCANNFYDHVAHWLEPWRTDIAPSEDSCAECGGRLRVVPTRAGLSGAIFFRGECPECGQKWAGDWENARLTSISIPRQIVPGEPGSLHVTVDLSRSAARSAAIGAAVTFGAKYASDLAEAATVGAVDGRIEWSTQFLYDADRTPVFDVQHVNVFLVVDGRLTVFRERVWLVPPAGEPIGAQA